LQSSNPCLTRACWITQMCHVLSISNTQHSDFPPIANMNGGLGRDKTAPDSLRFKASITISSARKGSPCRCGIRNSTPSNLHNPRCCLESIEIDNHTSTAVTAQQCSRSEPAPLFSLQIFNINSLAATEPTSNISSYLHGVHKFFASPPSTGRTPTSRLRPCPPSDDARSCAP